MYASTLCYLAPGTVVSVPVDYYGAVVNHVGLVTGQGFDGPTVIHASKQANKRVVETNYSGFVSGQVPGTKVMVLDHLKPEVPVDQVIRNARSRLNTPWRLTNNCEHFVRWALGHKKITSPQLALWAFVVLFAGSMAAVAYGLLRGK